MSQQDNKKLMIAVAGGVALLATAALIYNYSKQGVAIESQSGSVDKDDQQCLDKIKKLGPPKFSKNGQLEFTYLL